MAALLVLTTGLLVCGLVVYRAARHEPAFYRQALLAEPELQTEAGASLEQSVLDLHNTARREGDWQAVFTEEQLNGWLAADLPVKYPSLLPPGALDPRVNLAPQFAQVACRVKRGKINSVVSFAIDVALTEETNQLAVRIFKVRAGALPVPLKRFLDRITSAAAKADIALSWKQTDGDPVALVTVPVSHEDYAHREVYLETVELRDGEVYLSGRTEAPPAELARSNRPSHLEENRAVQ